jgi:(E)-4-hydroxy-3-methylbut-2-enyl-diphosphate synthase
MKILRRKSKTIRIGNISIGGNNPVAIQSMAKVKTADSEMAIKQIKELENTGCEIVRLAVKDKADAKALKKIKQCVDIPVVADIHFDWRLAQEAIDSGVDKIRLNPGNIYKREQIREIARAAKINRIPIRVGVNSGSVRSRTSHLAGRTSLVDRMVKSALDYIKILEGCGFYDIVVSLKASHIFDTIESYRKMAKSCDYPFHLGVTATGSPYLGIVKSSIALSILLLEGIGDTIRVSLTDKPQVEVKAAQSILEATGLRCFGPQIISCPTCGRCEVNLLKIVRELENSLTHYPVNPLARLTGKQANRQTGKPIKVAVMGCVVNGPGEAKEADIGIAFGKKEGLLFKKGKAIRKVPFSNCTDILLKEIAQTFS